jgi:FkbM family methyltransferase
LIIDREKIDRYLLKLVRTYTYNTPIDKGKHRAYDLALKACRAVPDELLAITKDGRKFKVHLDTGIQNTLFFHGEYETVLTRIIRSLLRNGDVCIDVGANFGWYTTLFRLCCGASAQIHSFEPMPPTFAELKANVELMGSPPNVFINHLALGDKPGELSINLFEGLSSGHASLSDQGRDDAVAYRCDVATLDAYLMEKSVDSVNVVKVDIEGAELRFLNGAQKLFDQDAPPIFLMEMALNQTKNFGYVPNDLVDFIRQHGEYEFYRADELSGKLIRFERFDRDDLGANVICFPKRAHADRFDALRQFIK